MEPKALRFFFYSAGALLLAAASAKLISTVGSDEILRVRDPLLKLPFRVLFWIAGAVELVVALFCFFAKSPRLRTGLVAFLAFNFLFYRVSIWLADYHHACNCLGTLTGTLHLTHEAADNIMKGVLAYLLVGSVAGLLWLRRQGRPDILPGVPTPGTPSLP